MTLPEFNQRALKFKIHWNPARVHLKTDPTGKGHSQGGGQDGGQDDGQDGGQDSGHDGGQDGSQDDQGSRDQDQPARTMQQRNTMTLTEVNQKALI